MRISTVNMIEYYNGTVNLVTAFTDDKDGNAEAEDFFTRVAKENGMKDADTDDCLEEGMYEREDYQVFLTHSETTEAYMEGSHA
jgi:hypothetical protein